jgi:iron complex outermembrane receptor protein
MARNRSVLLVVCGLLLGMVPSRAQETPATGGEQGAGEVEREGEGSFAETLTVTAASRRRERLVEAPAAVTTVGEEEAALTGAAGQVPSLLAFTVGTQVTQSGIYDFNLNIRGFNGFLNRRIQTLVDGRDPSIPETSGMEWWTLSFLTDDLASVELLRGPGSALYGANSINGVLSLTTRDPRSSQGGKVGLTAGDLDTLIVQARVAGSLGRDWYYKALGHHTQSDSFTESRTESFEYPGVPKEAVPSRPGGVDSDAASLRLDKYLADGDLLTLEGGGWTGGGETFMTQAGRVQQTDVDRSWARLAFGALHWSFNSNYTRRDGVALARQPGVFLYTQSRNARFELIGERGYAQNRGHLVGGISYLDENAASADPRGVETLYENPIDTHEEAVFLQATQDLSAKLKAVVALRWDESTLHDAQLSPRAALVWTPGARHTLRLAYNEAFQVGNYTELYLRIPGGPPFDLSALETALAPVLGGVPLGLGSVPLFALGNPDLEVEKIRSFELGYHGILGARFFLTADYYRNEIEDFISNLLPGVNPAFPQYRAPSQLSPEAAALVESTLRSLIPGLTNGPDGLPWIVASHTNTGRVDSQGIEVALSYQPSPRWQCQVSGNWFDFDVREETPGAEVVPNTPEWQASAFAIFRAERLSAALGFRWMDSFPWASGIFAGPVPSYQVMDLNVTYALSPSWELGLEVSNLLDDVHYEAFGGDLLHRRALGRVAFSW